MVRWLIVGFVVGCTPTTEDSGTVAPDLSTVPSGSYYVGLSIAAVGDLVVPFQLEVTPAATEDGAIVFQQFDLRAVADDDSASDVLASLTDLPVAADGGFDAVLPDFTLPGPYSPTGSDVVIAAELVADSVTADAFCGDVRGEIVTFGITLDGSTFGATRWDDRATAPFSCEPPPTEEIPRITDCPTLVEGANTGFPSGGRQRSFEIVLPSTYDPQNDYPLVFAYHGFGGNAADLLDGSELRGFADSLGIILVAPDADDLGGTPGFDPFSGPLTNVDLALFDDLLTCTTEQFSIDPEHVHVTGMSNGGLMTGYLIATRSDAIASAAPLSGGVGTDFLPFEHAVPSLVVWGGVSDEAFEQDFNLFATEMIDTFLANDQFVVACDTGAGHTLEPSEWPWVLQFLLDHPYTLASEPYADPLPAAFPGYCSIR